MEQSIQTDDSLDQLVSLLNRHYQPLAELKNQLRPTAEAITVLRHVGFDDSIYLKPYLQTISKSTKLIQREVQNLNESPQTTNLIFQRLVREIIGEKEEFSEKEYSSVKQLAALINPRLLAATDKERDTAAEHVVKNYKDTESVQRISAYLTNNYVFTEETQTPLIRKILSSYFSFITKREIYKTFFNATASHFVYLLSQEMNGTDGIEIKTYEKNLPQAESALDSLDDLSQIIEKDASRHPKMTVFGDYQGSEKRIQSILRPYSHTSLQFY